MANVSLVATGATDGGTSLVVSLSAVSNGLLVIYCNKDATDNGTATFDGNAMTKFAYSAGFNTAQSCDAYYYLTSTTQTSKTIAISGGTHTGIQYQYFQNAAQQAPQDITTGNGNAGTSFSLTDTVSVANSMVSYYLRETSGTGTVGTNMTVDHVDSTTTGSIMQHSTSVQGTGNFTATANTVAPSFAGIVCSIQSETVVATKNPAFLLNFV